MNPWLLNLVCLYLISFTNYFSKFQRSRYQRDFVDKLAFEFVWCIYIYNIVYKGNIGGKPMVQLILLQLKLSSWGTDQEQSLSIPIQ